MIEALLVALYVATTLYATYLNWLIDRLIGNQKALIESAEKLIEVKDGWKQCCIRLLDETYPEIARDLRKADAEDATNEFLQRVGKP